MSLTDKITTVHHQDISSFRQKFDELNSDTFYSRKHWDQTTGSHQREASFLGSDGLVHKLSRISESKRFERLLRDFKNNQKITTLTGHVTEDGTNTYQTMQQEFDRFNTENYWTKKVQELPTEGTKIMFTQQGYICAKHGNNYFISHIKNKRALKSVLKSLKSYQKQDVTEVMVLAYHMGTADRLQKAI